jgi:hypothetical protein
MTRRGTVNGYEEGDRTNTRLLAMSVSQLPGHRTPLSAPLRTGKSWAYRVVVPLAYNALPKLSFARLLGTYTRLSSAYIDVDAYA